MSSDVVDAIGVVGNTVAVPSVALVAVQVGTVNAESSAVVCVTIPKSPAVMPGLDPIVTEMDVALLVAAWTTTGVSHTSPPALVNWSATAIPGVDVVPHAMTGLVSDPDAAIFAKMAWVTEPVPLPDAVVPLANDATLVHPPVEHVMVVGNEPALHAAMTTNRLPAEWAGNVTVWVVALTAAHAPAVPAPIAIGYAATAGYVF